MTPERRRSARHILAWSVATLLIVSSIANLYQYKVIKEFKSQQEWEELEILNIAAKAFEQHLAKETGEQPVNLSLDRFERHVVLDEKSKKRFVVFRYQLEGQEATTIYTFRVKNEYVVEFEGLREFGAL